VYDRFVDQLLASGLTEPVSLDWLPGGQALILERAGGIKILDMSATPPSVTDYFTIPDVETVGETGALDGLVPADFATSAEFFVFYIKHTTQRMRVARFDFTGSAADVDSERVIWQSPNVVVNEQHVGGGLTFDKNGYLYVSLGDNWNPPNSQNLSTVWGSVLRLNRNGSVPAENPFNDGAGPNADAIFAYGLRNPFRLYLEADGDVRIGDVGGNDQNTAFEEFNHLRKGANYGWPNCEGPCGQLPNVTEPWYG
jgi:glucose/arabinose dehydrogenase